MLNPLLARGRDRLETEEQSYDRCRNPQDPLLARGRDRLETNSSIIQTEHRTIESPTR